MNRPRDIARLLRGYLLFARNPSGGDGCQPQVWRQDDGGAAAR
jgi:hypothetical protein